MKLITELTDDAQLLGKLYASADIVNKCLEETKLMDIRKKKPTGLPVIGKDDPPGVKEEKLRTMREMIMKQAKDNLMEMAKKLMVDKPEYAIELLHSLIILEEGEEFPKGVKLFSVATRAFVNPDVLDFFTTLMQLDAVLSDASSPASTSEG